MQFTRLVTACCEDGVHPLAAATVLFRQAKALYRIAVDLPEPLAGKRQLDQPHEGGHILCRVADEEADLVGERIIPPHATAQLTQQCFARSVSLVAGLAQEGADTRMSQVTLKLVVVVAEQQQRSLPGLHHNKGEIGKADGKLLVMALPELVEISTAWAGAINQRDQISRFYPGQHLGTFQQHMCGQAVQRITEACKNLRRIRPGGWFSS